MFTLIGTGSVSLFRTMGDECG